MLRKHPLSASARVKAARPALMLTVVLLLCGGLKDAPSAGLRAQAPDRWNDIETTRVEQFGLSDPSMEQRRLRAINTERQKLMTADTEKLLKLVRALNEEVEKTHPDSLTPAQLRTVAEIEKLAHSVKEKMSYSYMGGPEFREPPHVPGSVR
jgi:hypothetical protein